ncbi:MAG: LysM peptidoglycan-binding domain-containing protein [Chloroflexi bacterium]|nr:LysM peptidoglycan-binding domain-containing protein [Chloroflexota bacterium]
MIKIRLLVLFLIALSATACSSVAVAFAPTLPADEFATYIVQPGDTLSDIAARHFLSIEQLIALNTEQYPALARDPSLLQIGWQLRVPGQSAVAAARTNANAPDYHSATEQIISEINTARAQRGLALLRADATLAQIATDRSADMIARDYFSHYDPATAQQPLLRYLQASKYGYRAAGENIAEIKNDAAWVPPWLTVGARYAPNDLAREFVKGWLNSPEHRANILSAHYRRTGVALSARGDARRIVATQVFSD